MKRRKGLTAARERADLSQADVAKKLGVTPSTVAGLELGTHGIRLANLTKLARLLGAEIVELVA